MIPTSQTKLHWDGRQRDSPLQLNKKAPPKDSRRVGRPAGLRVPSAAGQGRAVLLSLSPRIDLLLLRGIEMFCAWRCVSSPVYAKGVVVHKPSRQRGGAVPSSPSHTREGRDGGGGQSSFSSKRGDRGGHGMGGQEEGRKAIPPPAPSTTCVFESRRASALLWAEPERLPAPVQAETLSEWSELR